jgi:hypothetical protein
MNSMIWFKLLRPTAPLPSSIRCTVRSPAIRSSHPHMFCRTTNARSTQTSRAEIEIGRHQCCSQHSRRLFEYVHLFSEYIYIYIYIIPTAREKPNKHHVLHAPTTLDADIGQRCTFVLRRRRARRIRARAAIRSHRVPNCRATAAEQTRFEDKRKAKRTHQQ